MTTHNAPLSLSNVHIVEIGEETQMNLLEDPGRFHWKWVATAVGLLVIYAIERIIRTGGLF